jgi:hypothetical protein
VRWVVTGYVRKYDASYIIGVKLNNILDRLSTRKVIFIIWCNANTAIHLYLTLRIFAQRVEKLQRHNQLLLHYYLKTKSPHSVCQLAVTYLRPPPYKQTPLHHHLTDTKPLYNHHPYSQVPLRHLEYNRPNQTMPPIPAGC